VRARRHVPVVVAATQARGFDKDQDRVAAESPKIGLHGANCVEVFLAQMIAQCNNVRTK